jgi:chromosome segregation protein
MLNLERMALCGFKSFSDRTEVHFRPGITAIVGPNGCGKSNLGDAINWVLGEQSAKMLRGQHMSDVIFSGTEARKPVGMAEVTLIFSGADGLPHDDQGKISITRRLFRSGESEYLLNGARSRLKDIQEVLRQGKVGARTYATIEQGRIDQVLNAKPKDRRALIEDAAGISGYRNKRRLAELKLEATEANLLRVQDVLSEVGRQINSLKRQAARARRYRKLREELRERELSRFGFRARALETELAAAHDAERAARDAESAAAAALAGHEADLVREREAVENDERGLRELAESLHKLELELDRSESRIRTARERVTESDAAAERHEAEAARWNERLAEIADLARRQEGAWEEARAALAAAEDEARKIADELAAAERERDDVRREVERLRARELAATTRETDLRNREQAASDTLERDRKRRTRLETEMAVATEDRSRLRSEASALAEEAERARTTLDRARTGLRESEDAIRATRAELEQLTEAMAEARGREESAAARVATLEDLETRFAGVSDGVKIVLAAGERAGIRALGVVADYVEATREVEGAAECYLGTWLPTVIVEDDADTCRAARYLRESRAGRTSLLSRTQPAGALAVGVSNGNGSVPDEVLRGSGVLGRLRDRLRLKSGVNGVLADRVGDAILVDTLETALDLHRRYPAADYVTECGEVVYASGVVAAGGIGGDRGLLAHQRRVHAARAEREEAAARRGEVEAALERLRGDLGHHENERAARARRLEEEERRSLELDLRVERSTDETERTDRQSRVLSDELAGLVEEIASLEGTRAELESEAEAARRERAEVDAALSAVAGRIDRTETTLRALVERASELRAEVSARRERREAVDAERARRLADEEEVRGRRDTAASGAATERQRSREAKEVASTTEARLVELHAGRDRARGELADRERSIAERRESMSLREAELRAARAELEARREASRETGIGRTRAESARQHLDDLCRQELGIDAGHAASSLAADAEVDLPALEAEIDGIKERIERLGPVNMTAIEEFSELEERHEFLSTQKTDLERSMESLRESIRRINRQSRQRFVEAFDHVRASFQEVFRLLFNGGRADLQLEEGEDVLECGIEILAQPPGKRLASIQLLSGGEKALSAIALLFAIFRYQPSPFCLLDEVDAPLDDTNVGRFARMVREYARNTQFILVTHNKLSMDAADVLYGVTMEEPGVSKLMSLELQ